MDKTSPCNTCTRTKDPEGCPMFRDCPEYRTWLRNEGWPGRKGTEPIRPRQTATPEKGICANCGKPIPEGRPRSRYCCELCRLQAQRKREIEKNEMNRKCYID